MNSEESDETKSCVEGSGDSAGQRVVRPSEVPEYLRESEFYKFLNIEDDEEFFIPTNLMKANMDVKSLQDCSDVLQTIRFWGVETTPLSLVQFALNHSFKDLYPVFSVFQKELGFVRELVYILNKQNPSEKRTERAMGLGIIQVVRHLDKTGGATYTQKSLALAAGGGHMNCLRHALHLNLVPNSLRSHDVYRYAVANGEVECVKLLDQSYLSIAPHHRLYPPAGYRRPSFWVRPRIHLASVAAAHGQLECLEYLHQKGCPLFQCAEPAAASGSLPCLQYIVERRTVEKETTYGVCIKDGNTGLHVCIAAAINSNRRCLEYLLENGYPTGEKLCHAAVKAQSVACLRCAHERRGIMGVEVGITAASNGSLACLQYFFENGGEWHFWVCHVAALHGHLHCLQYAYEHGCSLMPTTSNATGNRRYYNKFRVKQGPGFLVELSAARKHWSCVLYLILQGCPLTRGLTARLAHKNKDSLLKLAAERGCAVATEVGVRYAKVGSLEGVKFALEHGCDPSTLIPIAAARRGHLQCLIYAFEQGCPWSEEVCVAAARGNHLDCLRYAREHGCRWNSKVLLVAEKMGHDDVVQYAKGNGCPEHIDAVVGV